MIVSKKKPIEELMGMLGGAKKVALVGCKSCASACAVGGEKECNEMKHKRRLKFNRLYLFLLI